MKNLALLYLICLSLLTTSIFAQTSQPIPEEARKHFIKGTTFFKDAKTTNDFALVVSEFKQAADLAPQWPDARYNLALAEEAAGDYYSAISDLHLYQQFKLSDTEARMVQDKMYAIEAKQQKKVSDDAAKTDAARAKTPELHFEGNWNLCAGTYKISRNSSGNYVVVSDFGYSNIESVKVIGRNISFTDDMKNYPGAPQRLRYDLTLSEDGEKLVGTCLDYRYKNGREESIECNCRRWGH